MALKRYAFPMKFVCEYARAAKIACVLLLCAMVAASEYNALLYISFDSSTILSTIRAFIQWFSPFLYFIHCRTHVRGTCACMCVLLWRALHSIEHSSSMLIEERRITTSSHFFILCCFGFAFFRFHLPVSYHES